MADANSLREGDVRPTGDTQTSGYVAVLRRDGAVVASVAASDKISASEIVEQWRDGSYKLLTE